MVLLCESLGGCHHRRLTAVESGAQHRIESNDGLARTHLAHQQPLHRNLLAQIVIDPRDGLFLVGGQSERKRFDPALGPLVGRAQRNRPHGTPSATPAHRKGCLVQRELFECECLTRSLQ